MKMEKVSVVMCTYNGAKYLREQVDSILAQTYPLHEIIIQDDGSTDGTIDIIREYESQHDHIHYYPNTGKHGVNHNFFSAIDKATGDYIAICDQDDIWESRKIEKQVAAIGDNLLCVCRTKPFAETVNVNVGYDERTPNYNLIRLLYASICGHTMLFRRELLSLLPPYQEANKTMYDVYFSITAASYCKLDLVDEVLVHQRRHVKAVTFVNRDEKRSPSVGNGLYILRWSICNFFRVIPYMREYFQRRYNLMSGIDAQGELFDDALRIVRLQSQPGFMNMLRLCRMHIKHRHHLFYTEGRGFVNFCRAMLYCIMQVYNYRYLLPIE